MTDMNPSKELRERIRKLEKELGVLKDSQLSCCGVTLAQCHALVEIGRAGRISLSELARLLNLENSSMSRTVDKLVTKGMVKRDIDPVDRRYLVINLTARGEEVYRKIEENMNLFFEKIYLALPAEKRNDVLESLNVLLASVEKVRDE
ncbi:MAG TPA: MarR family transcriptional regulator [Defluviitaleaceae bacterium]|jgi:DNA-binding MarR family transcriptional regulator|nr:MarR family transcriptional regulator [Defluviitaleaceae bacterium]HPT77476.1 MarR family transcriptional regulator [Defluviitaleaceae bacterium]